MGNYLFLLLLLACPLMMIWMMRGMHGRHDAHGHSDVGSAPSLGELRRRRDQLDRQIEEREVEEHAAVGGDRE
jgi:hypothetical protein